MQWFWIFYPIITGVLLYFAVYELAKMDLFWTFLESGNIGYIYVGDTLKRVIADVEGKIVDKYIIRDKLPGDQDPRSWIERRLGLYWLGLPPFSKVKKFEVPLRKEAEDTADKPAKDWIESKGKRTEKSLRFAFIRPVLLQKAELGVDRQTVDVLVAGKFEVVNTYIPVPQLKGDFWTLLESLLSAAVLDIIENCNDMDTFLKKDKSDSPTSVLFPLWQKDPSGEESAFNKNLISRTGVKLVGASVPRWDPSDEAVRKAMQLRFVAEREQEEAVTRAATLQIQTDAEALAQKKLAEARGARVKETVAGIASSLPDAGHDAVVQAVATILQAEAHAGKDSKITTVVNGTAQPVIPLGGGK